jgi:FkbM family methyltransferase
MRRLRTLLNRALHPFNLHIEPYTDMQRAWAAGPEARDLAFLRAVPDKVGRELFGLLGKSRAQLRQDLFVLAETDLMTQGYFVEFGATNGVDLSNTCLLEQEFGWRGILAEPAKCWHAALRQNRRAVIETDCVWTVSDETLEFNEVGVYSTIDALSAGDMHKSTRAHGQRYSVKTVSLMDMLRRHGAPKDIEYLSIDTEGSEFDILREFDFAAYNIKIITCEHNFTPARSKIYDLLTSRGYVRKLDAVSQFDDWYVKPT